MADNQDEAKRLETPNTMKGSLEVPKLERTPATECVPRLAKVVMPFLDEMTDEAMAEFRKRMDAERDAQPTRSSIMPRSA